MAFTFLSCNEKFTIAGGFKDLSLEYSGWYRKASFAIVMNYHTILLIIEFQ